MLLRKKSYFNCKLTFNAPKNPQNSCIIYILGKACFCSSLLTTRKNTGTLCPFASTHRVDCMPHCHYFNVYIVAKYNMFCLMYAFSYFQVLWIILVVNIRDLVSANPGRRLTFYAFPLYLAELLFDRCTTNVHRHFNYPGGNVVFCDMMQVLS